MKELPPYSALDLYALAFGRDKPAQGRQQYGCPDCQKKWTPGLLVADGLTPYHAKGKVASCPGVGKEAIMLERRTNPAVVGQFEGFEGAKISAASLLRNVQAKYTKERAKIVWRRERRTPEYLYPYPFPVHQQAWEVMFLEQGKPCVLLGLPGGRVSLRLRNGPEFAHAIRVLKQIEAGDVAKMQLSLCRQTSYVGGHQRVVTQGRNSYRVMVRISYRIEVNAACGTGKVATLKTGRDPFLSMLVEGAEKLWVLHAPQAYNWIVEHAKFLQDFADDLKYEKRWPADKRDRLNRYRERRCEKQHDRLDTFLKTTAEQVVGHAKRNVCARILYNDADRSFISSFPWHQLTACLQNKCDEEGLTLEIDHSEDAADEGEEVPQDAT